MWIKLFITGIILLKYKVTGSFHYADSNEQGVGHFEENQDEMDEYFDKDQKNMQNYKTRTLARAVISNCDTLDWQPYTVTLEGKRRDIYIPLDTFENAASFNWYGAQCCCRSRGQYLLQLTTRQQMEDLYKEIERQDDTLLQDITWIDVVPFTGAFKTFVGDSLDNDIFRKFAEPDPEEEACGYAKIDTGAGTINVRTRICADAVEAAFFICEDRDVKLKDDCFRKFEGIGDFAQCHDETLKDYARHKICPKYGTPSHCNTLEFNKLNVNDGRTKRGVQISKTPASTVVTVPTPEFNTGAKDHGKGGFISNYYNAPASRFNFFGKRK